MEKIISPHSKVWGEINPEKGVGAGAGQWKGRDVINIGTKEQSLDNAFSTLAVSDTELQLLAWDRLITASFEH